MFFQEKIKKIIAENTSKSFDEYTQKQNQRIADRNYRNQQLLEQLTDQQIRDAEREMDEMLELIEAERDLDSIKVHIDMDAYFAAVEMRDNPRLRTIPMAVGNDRMLVLFLFCISIKFCIFNFQEYFELCCKAIWRPIRNAGFYRKKDLPGNHFG